VDFSIAARIDVSRIRFSASVSSVCVMELISRPRDDARATARSDSGEGRAEDASSTRVDALELLSPGARTSETAATRCRRRRIRKAADQARRLGGSLVAVASALHRRVLNRAVSADPGLGSVARRLIFSDGNYSLQCEPSDRSATLADLPRTRLAASLNLWVLRQPCWRMGGSISASNGIGMCSSGRLNWPEVKDKVRDRY